MVRSGTHQPVYHVDMFVTLAGRGPDGRYRVLVGDPALASDILDEQLPEHAHGGAFDEVAAALAAIDGLDVIRNPLPLIYADRPESRTRQWYFASANNCWVQDDEAAGRTVWLPEFGQGQWRKLCKTDEANAAVWRALGFHVVEPATSTLSHSVEVP